jgi:beta-lactamase regulating signal transducer with metallopeptidase domain
MGRDRICLPRRALAEFDHEHLEGMLAHELAHLERRDAAWLVVARCIEAVCFFQPLNRLARRRMVEAAEFAADAWAAHLTARPVTLARCLARVAEWQVGKAAPAPAMAEGRSSILVRRVRRLTTGVPLRPPARPAWLAAAAAMVALPLLAPRPLIGAAHPAVRRDARQLMIITRDVPGRLPPVLTDQDVVFLHMRRT